MKAMQEKQEQFHLLETEFNGLQQARDDKLTERLNAELATSAEELGGLKKLFDEAKTARDTYDTEETRLKEAKAALDNDANATEEQKQDAQKALEDHQATK